MNFQSKYFKISFFILLISIIVFSVLRQSRKSEEIPVPDDIKFVEKTGFLNLHDSVAYVGIEKCKQCHLDMYNSYVKTGMGQSWDSATKQKSKSVFTPGKYLYDEKTNLYYQPFWNGSILIIKEFRLENGDTSYLRNEIVDYIVGSGQHTNSHLKSVNGYLFQIPFTFYTQPGILDFPPGFEGGNNARFSRPIGFECVTCHNSYPKPVLGSINKYKSIPLGINCERCHGPGELHVKAMEAGEIVNTDLETDYTIVNPRKLSPDLRFELCARCHSQGNAVLQKGKTFFDFKPGMHVSDVMEVFRERYENDEDAFWMETHPERLKKSQCYKKSANNPDFEQLTCTDCHFTSSLRHFSFKDTPTDTFIAKCLNCHGPSRSNACSENMGVRNSQADNCIKCHMVKTGVFDIPHVMISDHFIRITDKWKNPIKSTGEIETGKFLGLKCMTNDHPDELIVAQAFMFHFEKFSSQISLLDSALKYLKKFPVQGNQEYWVYYHFLKQNYKQIIEIAEKYGNSKIIDPVYYYQVGQSYNRLNKHDQAISYFKKAVQLQPFNLDYRNKLASEFFMIKNYKEAKKEFEFILKENPKIATAWNNIGFIYLAEKDFINAEKSLYSALRLDPDYLSAHLNLIKLYIGKGQLTRAKEYADNVVKKFPGNPQAIEFTRLLSGQ